MVFDFKKPHCLFFNEICKIPHGSCNERALSNWLVDFAKKRGLKYIQDELQNVIIYKPATFGLEHHPGVILQAHMDMVCEKTPESLHNFETDALTLYVEGDYLRAKGTTLGADDGMGCAYMLAILDDNEISHPFLECCFTTQEETGLVGAQNLKGEYFKARRLINLDGAGEVRTYVSMGGGRKITLHKTIEFQPSSMPVWFLEIKGLLGGHSGGMIDKERANAIKLAAQVLHRLSKKSGAIRIVRINGGTKPNIIPACSDVIFSSDATADILQKIVDECSLDFAEEYEFSDPGIQITLTQLQEPAVKALSLKDSDALIKLLYLLPHGQVSRSLHWNIPVASSNLAMVSLDTAQAEITVNIRSAMESWAGEMENGIYLLAEMFGASATVSNVYPGWKYEENSPLREKMKQVYQQMYGQPLNCLAGHGGNECGVFKKMHPDMDIVTSGAIYGNIHTTDEFLDLASFDRAYAFLTSFLAQL